MKHKFFYVKEALGEEVNSSSAVAEYMKTEGKEKRESF